MVGFLLPGQASQFVGMGRELWDASSKARQRFEEANEILGFDISKIMFEGTERALKETKVTQPAVFLHSTILAEINGDIKPGAVAGHSLGEFSALVINGVLTFEEGLKLVKVRSEAMQEACEKVPGTMAAIVGLEDEVVEGVCDEVEGVVIAANYNCPGQLVISGAHEAVREACERLTQVGARRAIELAVGGAFHSPLMLPAQEKLTKAIHEATFSEPQCPIYQNVDGLAQSDLAVIKDHLIMQLTSPVRWTLTLQQMIADGMTEFVEVGGSGKVLQSMLRRVDRSVHSSTMTI